MVWLGREWHSPIRCRNGSCLDQSDFEDEKKIQCRARSDVEVWWSGRGGSRVNQSGVAMVIVSTNQMSRIRNNAMRAASDLGLRVMVMGLQWANPIVSW